MTPLALTVPLSRGETATSFASRLAARNGSRYVQDFVQDMGLSWRAVVAGEAETLAELAVLGSIDLTALERYAFRLGEEGRRHVGPESVHHKMLRHIRQHVCPLCLREADDFTRGAPVTWQLEPVRRCPVHSVALVELAPAEPPRSIHDLAGRVHDDRALIRAAARDREPIPISAFDRYLTERVLDGRRGASWLDGSDLHSLWRASETLGTILLHGPSVRLDRLRPEDLSAAAAAGFDAISGSRADLTETLQMIHRGSTGERGGFYSEFRPFAIWIGKLHRGPGSTDVLETVRDFVEQTYPVGPGEDVLGRPCQRRHVHSVMTAARAYQVNWTRMQRLVRAVADTPGHSGLPAPTRHLWFDANVWEPFLRRYTRALNPKRAAAALGVRPEFFVKMSERGWVAPIVSFPGLIERYDLGDLQALLGDMFRRSVHVTEVEKDMASLFSAYAKCHCDTLELMDLIRGDRLAFVGRLAGVSGLRALLIRPHEVLAVLARPQLEGYHYADLKRLFGMNSSTASWLMQNGWVRCERRWNPRTRRAAMNVTHEALEAFKREFVTLSQIAQEQSTLPKHAAARLARQGVHPIALPLRCSKLYRRADLDEL